MNDYIFSQHENKKEYLRLRLIERAFDDTSKAVIKAAGIKKGWSCLELGPGAGSILRWMGDQVGRSGYVLGVDKNAEFINSLTQPHVDVREGMIQEMGFKERFDLIHARYFFIHNTNTKALLTKVSGLLKPGGALVLEEPDFSIARWIDNSYAAYGNRVNRAICTMFNNMGLNPAYGTEAALDLAGCGLTLTHIEADMHLDIGRSNVAQIMAESTKILKEKYVNTGEADETDIAKYIEGAGDPDSLAIYYATISIIGKKPRKDMKIREALPTDLKNIQTLL